MPYMPYRASTADTPLTVNHLLIFSAARTLTAIHLPHTGFGVNALHVAPEDTGQTMAGLIAPAHAGRHAPFAHRVFLHTGGAPARWTYPGIFHPHEAGGQP